MTIAWALSFFAYAFFAWCLMEEYPLMTKGVIMELAKIVAKALIAYHTTCIDITNCLGQLHMISDDTWEERNKNHFMAMICNPQINPHGLFINDDEEHS